MYSAKYSILQKNPNAIVYFLTSSEGKINYRVRIFLQDTVPKADITQIDKKNSFSK
jgi:hypothetical protein